MGYTGNRKRGDVLILPVGMSHDDAVIRLIATLQTDKEQLEAKMKETQAALNGRSHNSHKPKRGRVAGRKLSAAARKRISEAQRRRWKEVKRASRKAK